MQSSLKHLCNNLKELGFSGSVRANEAEGIKRASRSHGASQPQIQSVKEPSASCGLHDVHTE